MRGDCTTKRVIFRLYNIKLFTSFLMKKVNENLKRNQNSQNL